MKGRPKGSLNKAKVIELGTVSDHLKKVETFKISYDFGYEGGIAVYVSMGEYGEKIVSVPRLGLSTCVLSDYDVTVMLLRDRGLWNRRTEADQFAAAIVRDIQLYRHKSG